MANPRIGTAADTIAIAIFSLVAGIYAITDYQDFSGIQSLQDFGICFSSPEQWISSPAQSGTLNLIALFLAAGAIYLINRTFGVIISSTPLMASIFLPLCCGNIFIAGRLNSATICLIPALASIATLYNVYNARNATRSVFMAATWVSIGSMFNQGMILAAIALIPAVAEMKIGRFKEYLALLLGYISPYWIVLGLGIASPGRLRFTMPQPVFMSVPDAAMMTMTIFAGILLLAVTLISLSNAIKLYAGNTRIRNLNNVINFFGIAAGVGMIFDYSNIIAYLGIFNLWGALQIANLLLMSQLRHPALLYRIVILAIIGASVMVGVV